MRFFLILSLFFTTLLTAQEKHMTQKEKQALQKAMQAEKKYAKEQKFYSGSEYDLKAKEIDPESLKHIHVIEPENDFDMDDVYD
jgi:hypothetical protein